MRGPTLCNDIDAEIDNVVVQAASTIDTIGKLYLSIYLTQYWYTISIASCLPPNSADHVRRLVQRPFIDNASNAPGQSCVMLDLIGIVCRDEGVLSRQILLGLEIQTRVGNLKWMYDFSRIKRLQMVPPSR